MVDRNFFREMFGKKPSNIITNRIERGARNIGVFVHEAEFDVRDQFRKKKIIEKRSIHWDDFRNAELIFNQQRLEPSCFLFPKVYRYEKNEETIRVAMEFVEGVESPALRQDSTAEALASALAALNKKKFRGLPVPCRHNLFSTQAMRIERRLNATGIAVDFSHSLPAFLEISKKALMRVPLVVSHCDATFQNMAYDSVNNSVRFIDFEKMNYNFSGFDFWLVCRYGMRNNYNFLKLIDLYSQKVGVDSMLVKQAAMFAAADRCALNIEKGFKSGKRNSVKKEVELLNRIINHRIEFADYPLR